MKKSLYKNSLVIGIILLFIGSSVLPSTSREAKDSYNLASYDSFSENDDTEYWALIFAVGVYKNSPYQDRPFMLEDAEDLNNVLLDSPQWKKDHIHKVTGSDATGRRLIKELMWLIKNNDRNDMSLIYLTTHGSPLKGPKGNPIDIPPRDENDGADEILIMYDGFDKWYAFIWDDLLNFFLSLLKSKGVCLIVDSCYSGGFNDTPMFKGVITETYTAKSFNQGLAEELSGQNRIVLMSSKEDELSYGSYFIQSLIDGLLGGSDFWGNYNGINSAEESFNYSMYWMNKMDVENTPTIHDLYPGEFPITLSKYSGVEEKNE